MADSFERISDLREILTHMRNLALAWREEADALRAEKEFHLQKIAEQQENISGLEKRCDALERTGDRLAGDIKLLEDERGRLLDTNNDLRTKNRTLQGENEDLLARYKSLEKRIDDRSDAIVAMAETAELQKLKEEYNELVRKSKEDKLIQEARIKEAEDERNKYIKDNAALEAREREIKILNEKLSRKEKELNDKERAVLATEYPVRDPDGKAESHMPESQPTQENKEYGGTFDVLSGETSATAAQKQGMAGQFPGNVPQHTGDPSVPDGGLQSRRKPNPAASSHIKP